MSPPSFIPRRDVTRIGSRGIYATSEGTVLTLAYIAVMPFTTGRYVFIDSHDAEEVNIDFKDIEDIMDFWPRVINFMRSAGPARRARDPPFFGGQRVFVICNTKDSQRGVMLQTSRDNYNHSRSVNRLNLNQKEVEALGVMFNNIRDRVTQLEEAEETSASD